MAEENAQLDYLSKALAKANIDVTDSKALIEFVQREDVINALKDITEGKIQIILMSCINLRRFPM